MTGIARSENFGDLLDPRLQRIWSDRRAQLPDMLPLLFNFEPTNGRNNMTFSQVGAFDDLQPFTGQVTYDSPYQGYDTTLTPIEFTSGFQVERKLFDDDQYSIINQRPSGLARAYVRTRQRHGARIFTNAFSVDTLFAVNSEGVAMCSTSHTTTSPASTSVGFSNKGTSELSAVAVRAARIAMVRFLGDRGEKFDVMPDELWYPPELYERAHEINMSEKKPGTAHNDDNVHQGAYTLHEWQYLEDANNWFMGDSTLRAESIFWTDRVPEEFAMAEDIDTLVAKWRLYCRYALGWVEWRWCYGNEVS